jgi:hypothetical protein
MPIRATTDRRAAYFPAARAGPATTIPVTDAVPDWAERVAAAGDRRGRT